MHYQRVKAFEANSPRQLQIAINEFMTTIDRAPVNIDYKTAYRFYEDDPRPHPQFIAYIRFIDN